MAVDWNDPEPLEEQTVARLMRFLGAAHVGRAVPRQISLVSADYTCSFDPSDSDGVSDDADDAGAVPQCEPVQDHDSQPLPLPPQSRSRSQSPMNMDTGDSSADATSEEEGGAPDRPSSPMERDGVQDEPGSPMEEGELVSDDESDEAASVAADEPVDVEPRPRKRVAPELISTELSGYDAESIADSDPGEPPVPSLPAGEARETLAELFRSAAGQQRGARHRPERPALPARGVPGFLQRDQTDAFWFRRAAACQLTAANARRAQSVRRCAAL
ncbi:hypothetical protein H4R21_004724, partial [Coemansia helicoidea]